jgi:hypothetical protein
MIDSFTPLREVYAQLSSKDQSGGFFLTEAGRTRSYIKAGYLADEIVKDAKENPDRMRSLSDTPIGQIISNRTRTAQPDWAVPINPDPVDVSNDETSLRSQSPTVFAVIESGTRTGWYLNHESVRDTVTQRTWFICKKGHRNPDPDHGTCYRCPFPIESTQTE